MLVTMNTAYCLNVTTLWPGRQIKTLRKDHTASIFKVKDPEYEDSMVYVRPAQNLCVARNFSKFCSADQHEIQYTKWGIKMVTNNCITLCIISPVCSIHHIH